MTTIDDTLAERGARYGDFTDHARVAQALQEAMRRPAGWDNLSDVQRQALTVICDKMARIVTGDPNYADNWHDIQGYAKLVEDRLPDAGLSRIDRIFGWHTWAGSTDGKPPVAPETWVSFEQRNGVAIALCRADQCRWTHEGRHDDIVRYKVNDIVPEEARADDGWVEWCGGACPVAPDTLVEIRSRDGFTTRLAAGSVYWSHIAEPSDVVAYRVVESAKPKADDKWIDWRGGSCPLPPGTLVTLRWRDRSESVALAEDVSWGRHTSDADTIIAYRVIKD